MIAVWIASLLFIAAPATSLTGAWEHWHASRLIETHTTAQPLLVAFALPVAVYGSSQPGLEDLRIVDDAGQEVPYVIDTPQVHRSVEWSAARVFDTGFIPGRYTQAVADVGDAGTPHDLLRIEANPADSDFFAWVGVDASVDGRTWRIVRERAPIFRFASDGISGQLQISIPETRSRFLRVRILDGRK